ncbi:MAG: BtpA/SgcQ family protein [Leptolyngbya sp.]|nr:BtpA/SgcQ family protein [Candidatus Melainabacteria bacterium]
MFGRRCSVMGVVHVSALPGSAGYGGDIEKIVETALSDAMLYKSEGIDALMVENMHDAPYLRGHVYPETTAAMAIVASAIKRETKLPCGVQILAGANDEALGVAIASGLDFMRVEGFVFAHVGDEGFHDSCAATLIRRRANLKAEQIKIFADIKKKHSSHAITSDISIVETAHAAEFFKADGVVITGQSTGHAPDVKEVEAVKNGAHLPVLIGSGITPENLAQFAKFADCLIVGSSAKRDGHWANEVEAARVGKLMAAIAQLV